MRTIVTCDGCRHRQAVERRITDPETFHIVCHECERRLRVDVTDADLVAAAEADRQRAANRMW